MQAGERGREGQKRVWVLEGGKPGFYPPAPPPTSAFPLLLYSGLEGYRGHSQELRKWWVGLRSTGDPHGAIVWAQKHM